MASGTAGAGDGVLLVVDETEGASQAVDPADNGASLSNRRPDMSPRVMICCRLHGMNWGFHS